ncbi:alpha/beta hydrolase family esterase [Actibacterium lipolyticum]|uniref:Polyhydroxybutyrate depolymerase n=1 Tax=Actibacterium lipolyticum TaxID=1524263 RepID=A0A238JVN3_9RHOB|nr:hypothetical protein [Actibacterium lipolyticum]SMX34738.1 hypothetical protein COL8621_01464 [Actibacterium lipolyticum]
MIKDIIRTSKVAFAALCITPLMAMDAHAARQERTLKFGKFERSYIAHIPDDADARGKLSVIFAFHPGYGTSEGFEKQLGLHEAAGADDFIIVYPNGFWRSWNQGDCCGPAKEHNVDDVAFVLEILSDLHSFVKLDQGNHFATGFSNGAGMSQRLACELNSEIAAIAIAGGTRDNSAGCEMKYPVSVLMMHGLEDGFSPYDGGMGVLEKPGPRPSVDSNVDFWAKANNCADETPTTGLNELACDRHSQCDAKAEVVICPVPEMGHWFPGQSARSQRGLDMFGPTRDDLPGLTEVLSFFRTHGR